VNTFSGFEHATRRPVYLHLFGDSKSNASLGRLMQMIKQAEAAGQIIEAGEFGRTGYVITEPIKKFTNLRDYLEANPPAALKAKPPAGKRASSPPVPQSTPARPAPPDPGATGPEPRRPTLDTWPAAGSPPPNVPAPGTPSSAPPPPPPNSFADPSEPLTDVSAIFSSIPAPPPLPRQSPPYPQAFAGSTEPISEVSSIFDTAPAPPVSPQRPPAQPPSGPMERLTDVSKIFGSIPAPPPPAAAEPMPYYAAPPPVPAPNHASRTRLILLAAGVAILLIALLAHQLFIHR
jgi:hypothetical protein